MAQNKAEKIFRAITFFSKLASARLRKKRIPFLLYFLITERCNLRCPYCWIRRSENVYSKELSTGQIIQAINDFYVLGTRYISILGGEPLLRKDLGSIISHINRLSILNDVVTNGFLIDTQIEALKKFDLVCISLEGKEEEHDKDRGKGTYAKIIKNIELLKKHKIRFRFNTTVTQNTVDSFRHVARLAKEYNVGIAISIATVSVGKESEMLPNAEKIRDFWREVRELKISGYPVEKSLYTLNNLIKNADLFLDSSIYEGKLPKACGLLPCIFGKYLCYIGSNGDLFPCCHPDLYGKKNLNFNIFKQGAEKAWRNVVDNTSCIFCSMILGCEINHFLNLDARSVWETVYSFLFHR